MNKLLDQGKFLYPFPSEDSINTSKRDQSMAEQQHIPTAQEVGNSFVHYYYLILQQTPQLVHKFYQDSSKFGRPDADGVMSYTTTTEAINQKIMSLGFGSIRAEIKTVDAQESLDGGVLVFVTGYLIATDSLKRSFSQCFFLAPQGTHYFVLNDIFRYLDDIKEEDLDKSLNFLLITSSDPVLIEEQPTVEKLNSLSEDKDALIGSDVMEIESVKATEEKKYLAPSVDSIQNGSSQIVTNSISSVQEMPKQTYASIVKVTKERIVPATDPAKPIASPEVQRKPKSGSPPVTGSNSSSNTIDTSNIQEEEVVEGCSIYIKNLPLNATSSQLEEEFKKFGSIKPGGIHVRSNKQQGFCFGFLEYEIADSVRNAIKASPIMIGGRQAHVEEKRASGSRVINRGRFVPGRGNPFRNDGTKGRNNYNNPRSDYSKVDLNGRTDNWAPSRDGGYQKSEHNGRSNHAYSHGVIANAPKNIASRVAVPA